MGIGQERLDNSGSVLGRHPGLFNLDCRGSKETGEFQDVEYTCGKYAKNLQSHADAVAS